MAVDDVYFHEISALGRRRAVLRPSGAARRWLAPQPFVLQW